MIKFNNCIKENKTAGLTSIFEDYFSEMYLSFSKKYHQFHSVM